MIKSIVILFISSFISIHCWSQTVVKESKSEKTGIAKSEGSKDLTPKMSGRNNANASLKNLDTTAILLDVLFATNEDCDLFISQEFKGTVSKSKHKYIKLPPGSYVYKAKSKSTFDEFEESFIVKNGDSNEIFIDLLYVVDEMNQQRESLKNIKNTESQGLNPNENKMVVPNSQEKKVEPNKETENKILAPKPEEKKIETNKEPENLFINELLSNMVSIKEGSFIMGNNKAPSDDEAEHPVIINPILISKYEVTQQQWEQIMAYNPSNNKNCSTCPVENVSWEEAMTFIRKINQVSNKKFRLPTEAEWEYVAKIGGKSEIENEGGPEEYIKKTAWYYGNSDKKTHPVGQKQPNVSGIYDLFGNVSEWCADWYDADYYKKENSPKNPEGPVLGKEKVFRGGSYSDYSGDRFRPSLRNKLKPANKSIDIGFRLVMETN